MHTCTQVKNVYCDGAVGHATFNLSTGESGTGRSMSQPRLHRETLSPKKVCCSYRGPSVTSIHYRRITVISNFISSLGRVSLCIVLAVLELNSVDQAVLKLLDSPASASHSPSAEIKGMCHHAQQFSGFKKKVCMCARLNACGGWTLSILFEAGSLFLLGFVL